MRAIHWFRHDLRLQDNRALRAACAEAEALVPVFILDDALLAGERAGEPRRRFLLDCVARLAKDLEARGSQLVVRHGEPATEIARLLSETGAGIVSFGRAYAPAARRRDAKVRAAAARAGARVIETKDHVVFESQEVLTQKAEAFTVYSPYRRAWERAFGSERPEPEAAPRLPPPVPGLASAPLPEPAAGAAEPPASGEIGLPTGGERAAARRLDRFLERSVADYGRLRDVPAEDGTSRLSPYLRFGVISARTCIHRARELAALEPRASEGAGRWVDELVWRDFYWAILAENPRVTTENHRSEYDTLRWNDDEEGFRAWCDGRTGYPIVDAGMRQLARTGWMHNRTRMIVASFLTKDLLIDWRRGEAFFYRKLVDGDPASNNGGWQWAASTGTDAQPYFRIFNPVSQGERFDPAGRYVRTWVPELAGVEDRFVHRPFEAATPPADYPAPIVRHAERRIVALQRFEDARARARRT